MKHAILATNDGSHTLQSGIYKAAYHSTHGAVQESKTVFIQAAFLEKLEEGLDELSILEIGFGTGLNAFMTYLEAIRQQVTVHYVGIEKYPIGAELANQLNYPDVLNAMQQRAAFLQMHEHAGQKQRLPINDSQYFEFVQLVADFEELEAEASFDVIYHDAFAPGVQAQLWEGPFLERLFRALRPGGLLSTYCAKGAFKRALKAVGFRIEALPGPKGKREMTLAIKPD